MRSSRHLINACFGFARKIRQMYEYDVRGKEAPHPGVSISGDDMKLLQLFIYAELLTISKCNLKVTHRSQDTSSTSWESLTPQQNGSPPLPSS